MDGNTEFKNLGILWYDEENKLFRMQDVTLDEEQGTVSAIVTHFSKYMVVDKKAWFDTWQHQVVYDTEIEDIQTVLAIDCSGSMLTNDPGIYYYNHHETTTYREIAAEKFIDAMRVNCDMASIVTFTDCASPVVRMTNDKEALYEGLSNISSFGRTDLSAAIAASIYEFDESSRASKNIILLTDGEGGVLDSTLQDAVDKGVVIYVIGIGTDINSTVLKRIADYTGGEFYEAKTASEIVDIYGEIEMNQRIDETDTDGDGLADIFETAGMMLPNGKIIYTDPLKWDTDGDGLKDGDEISIVGYQTWNYELNDDGTYTEKQTYGYQFVMKSDPREADSDGDGLNDSLDNEPLNPKVHAFLIYETKSSDTDLKALDFDERPEDYKYADESYLELLGKFPINLDDVISTEQRHINNFKALMVLGTYQDSDMQSVALDMAEHFLSGSGEDYHNDILTQKVENHEATQYYVNSVSSILEDLIKSQNGNIASAAYTKDEPDRKNCYMVYRMRNSELHEPYFGDYFSGLGICIHSLYGNKFEVTSYEFDGNHYKYTLHFTMYDIFGLNSSDITKGYSYNDSYSYPYGLIPYFRSWYVLQHYNIYNGKYKPFISYIEFDKTFEGSIT